MDWEKCSSIFVANTNININSNTNSVLLCFCSFFIYFLHEFSGCLADAPPFRNSVGLALCMHIRNHKIIKWATAWETHRKLCVCTALANRKWTKWRSHDDDGATRQRNSSFFFFFWQIEEEKKSKTSVALVDEFGVGTWHMLTAWCMHATWIPT